MFRNIGLIVLLFISFISRPYINSGIQKESLTFYFTILIISLAFHFYNQTDKNLFRLDVLFLLGFIIVHFQWPAMIIFNEIIPDQFPKLKSNAAYLNYGTWLSLIGIISWQIGYAIFKNLKNKTTTKYKINLKKIYHLTLLLFVFFLLTARKEYLTGDIYSNIGTSETITGIAGYVLSVLIICIIILSTTTICLHKYEGKLLDWIRQLNKKHLALICATILVFLFAGDRGTALQIAIAFLLVFSTYVRPIPLFHFTIICIVGAFLLTILGITRSAGYEALDTIRFSSAYDLTINLANSAKTLYYGISDVVEQNGYSYGKLWISNILGVIPFAQSLYLYLSGDYAYMTNTAGYITYLRYGVNPQTGEGTSFIVDIFMNFGEYGVIIVMFLFGMIIKKIHLEMYAKKNIIWVIVGSLFGATTFYLGRASIFTPFKMVVWGLILSSLLIKKEREPIIISPNIKNQK